MQRRVWQAVATALVSVVFVASCSGSAGTGTTNGGDAGGSHDGASRDGGGAKGGDATSGGKDAGGSSKDSGSTKPGCGAATTPCANGGACTVPADCTSNVCETGKCVPPTCNDKIQDGSETDVDCGGSVCAGCPTGDKCKAATDCVSLVCTGGLCQAPTATDNVKNDSETDVDCGGALLASGSANPASDGAPVCAVGKQCGIATDCATLVCAGAPPLVDNLDAGLDAALAALMVDAATADGGAPALVCQPATPFDGVKNDSETDVDCGGALLATGAANTASDGAPACAPGNTCLIDADCATGVCAVAPVVIDNLDGGAASSGDAAGPDGGVARRTCQSATEHDGVKNDSETDVDCGGGFLSGGAPNPATDGAPACAIGKGCLLGTDCLTLVCAPGSVGTSGSPDGSPIDCPAGQTCTCQPPSPTDGVKNDSETDRDCGGALLVSGAKNTASDSAPVCQFELSQKCSIGLDCDSLVCNANNNAGGLPANCPNGASCTCQVPSSTDGVKNGGETDVDCGGASVPGSDTAPPCAPTRKCLIGSDCTSSICTTGKVCAAPSPTDGVKNGGETDVDCGGALLASGATNPADDGAPKCADSKSCLIDNDCRSAFCSLLSHTCVDGQSCKGLITPASIMDVTHAGSLTVKGADAVGVANPNGVGQSAGLDTCGAGESTDIPAWQSHESCCKSLPLPAFGSCSATVACPAGETCSSTTAAAGTCQARMDKYEVTTGRVRQFIEYVNKVETAAGKGAYNLQDWVTTQLAGPTAIGTLLKQQIPTTGATSVVSFFPTGDSIASTPTWLNVVAQLGGTTIDKNHPSGVQGCFVGVGDAGSSTYWWPSVEIAGVGSPPRPFTQDYYDIKPMNCTPYWIAAAFCAWDGGRLPTQAESNAVYGTSSYPWGASLYPNPYPGNTAILTNAYKVNGAVPINTFIPGNPNVAGAPGYTINFWNANLGASTGLGDFYFYPSYIVGDPAWANFVDTLSNDLDLSPYISAPGRFILDLTSKKSPPANTEGWMDYGANMMEYIEVANVTAAGPWTYVDTTVTPNVQRGTGVLAVTWEGGSWEGHGIQPGGYGEPLQTQYSKAGFRCVRPIEP